MTLSITAVIPAIASRFGTGSKLARALASVQAQTYPVAGIAVAVDHDHAGAWVTRQRALDMVNTEWFAFLDDDDEWMPHHLERCVQAHFDSGCDVIVPWFDVVGGTDPTPGHRDLQFPKQPELASLPLHSFGITCLVRTAVVRDAGVRFRERIYGVTPAEDALFWRDLADAGVTFQQIGESTWRYFHDGENTSGLGSRWP